MDQYNDNNKIFELPEDTETFEFKYNFINRPWDDRSKKSKFGIVALLVAIFVATMAAVVNNFVMHYRNFGLITSLNNEINCIMVKIEDHPFVARIHSMETKELLCVGAVISSTSVLANSVCIKSGPIRMFLGSPNLPHCKKGFRVDVIETIFHDGIISKKLALLSTYDDIKKCCSPISIGTDLNWVSYGHVVGRPSVLFSRTLSRQHVSMVRKQDIPRGYNIKNLKMDNTICVKTLTRCPIRAGDLLLQDGKLYGISSTSIYRMTENNLACFADLHIVRNDLKELDDEID